MSSSKVSYLLFTTLSLILIFHAPLPASCERLFESLCNETGNANDTGACLELLKNHPKITSATNYFDLSKLILNMGIVKATEEQKYFFELAKTNPKSEAINQCATSHYANYIRSFWSAKKELTEDVQTANYDAKVAGDGPVRCQESVDDEKLSTPTIVEINKRMNLLSFVAFLATYHLPQDDN